MNLWCQCKAKSLLSLVKGGFGLKIKPGTELFWQEATLQLSSPLQRFTTEFGMESVWVHRANSTRKASWLMVHGWLLCTMNLAQNLQDCIATVNCC